MYRLATFLTPPTSPRSRSSNDVFLTGKWYTQPTTTSGPPTLTWSIKTINSGNWESVAWASSIGTLAAVASNFTTTSISESLDGVTWNTETSVSSGPWTCVAWSPDAGIFCALANSGGGADQGMTSSDGITWTSHSTVPKNHWKGICWSSEKGLFVGVGSAASIITSSDGVTWATHAVTNIQASSVCWSAALGIFCTVGFAFGTSAAMTSSDGSAWTVRTTPNGPNGTCEWHSVIWSPTLALFVATGQDASTSGGMVMTSPDGSTWTLQTIPSIGLLTSVVWSPSKAILVAVNNNGAAPGVIISSDGITWTADSSAPTGGQWTSIVWMDTANTFVVVGYGAEVMLGQYV